MSKKKSKSSVTLIEGDIMMGTDKPNDTLQEEEDYTSINLMQASMNEIATFSEGKENVIGNKLVSPEESEMSKLTEEIAALRKTIEDFKTVAEKLYRRGR